MKKRKVANPLALAVLALAFERPMHPYEMASTMKERGHEASIKLNYGSLYTVIDALQRHGLIEQQETVREGRRPERTVYTITEAGRAELFDWLRELLSQPMKEYPQFTAGLALMGVLSPAEGLALLEERIGGLEREIADQRAMLDGARAQGIIRIFLVEGEHYLVLREAELAWVRDLVRDMKDGNLEGMDHWEEFHRRKQQERGGDAAATT